MRKKLSGLFDTVSNGLSSLKSTVSEYVDTKTALVTTFGSSVVLANVLASKIAAFDIPLYGMANAPAGFLALGVAYLCSDALTELYGAKTAHKAVNGTIVSVLAGLGLIHASMAMPSAPFYELGQQYNTILSSGTSISLASVLTMAVSQNLDVTIFNKIKQTGLPKWTRNVGSTVTSQFVDTALFIGLGFAVLPHIFGGTLTPLVAIPSLIVSQYIVKVLVALLDTPLFYLLTIGSEE